MSHAIPRQHPLRQLFRTALAAAFTERPDAYSPDVEVHLAEELLPDFVHNDRIFRLRDVDGRQIEGIADMVGVSRAPEGPERSLEVNRYIGDFVLFMASFFPSQLRRGHWFAPSRMVTEVGGILVSFASPFDYFTAEGRNAYSRAARTARLFDPTAEATYEALGAQFESYLEIMGLAKRFLDERAPGVAPGDATDANEPDGLIVESGESDVEDAGSGSSLPDDA